MRKALAEKFRRGILPTRLDNFYLKCKHWIIWECPPWGPRKKAKLARDLEALRKKLVGES